MKKTGKIVLIISALVVLLGVGLVAYRFLFSIKRYEKGAAKIGVCENLDPKAAEFGRVGVEMTSRATGRGVAGIDLRLGQAAGAKIFCSSRTGRDGLALFDRVPAGDWQIYYDPDTTPSEYLGPGFAVEGIRIKVSGGITSEAGILVK